jgi:Coenzyme PQQ synthesis protein D (PqqD)
VSGLFRIRDGVLEWREVEGDVVALDLRSKTYLAVNRTGVALWPALVSGADREELLACLLRTFSVSRDQAAADLDAFLAELAEQDLLEQE